MTFDVSKFLALTALLATAGIGTAACSSSNDDSDGSGGTSGSGGKSSGGEGGSVDGGAGNTGGQGGATDGVGGAAGGEGGLGGTAGAAAEGGAGGEGAEECVENDPSYEGDPCADLPDTKCDGAAEDALNPFSDSCYSTYNTNTNTRLAYAACLAGKDACDADSADVAAACWSTVAAQACPVEGAAAACTTVVGTCSTGLTTGACTDMLDAVAILDAEYLGSCMDPAGEYYDESLVGDCKVRLAECAGVLPL